ncbi:phage minor head protein [Sulfuricurvum sp. MLSB]|jgi:uncharacterized protein with gpF-like domain|uniref:phage head morphogenesis protein n=1 Tax=Sulfuricurvum sp. MLSB TaxID=1537917 RepID=UPI000B0FA3E5|nr:phage minor head protein [Sulfuricurvum sp. MLSB]
MTKAQRYRQLFLALHGKNERLLTRDIQKALRKDIRSLNLAIIDESNYEGVLLYLNLKNFEQTLIDFYIKAGTQTGEIAKKDIAKQVKRVSPFFSEVWRDFVIRQITPALASKVVTMKATLLTDLNKLITEYISLNLDIVDIASAITEFVNDPKFYKWQSLRIARTETTTAMNMAVNQVGADSDVLLDKEWISAGDGEVRESHQLMDGTRVEQDEPFGNGLMYPGDPNGDASEVVNCRCTFLQIPKRDTQGNLIFTV